MTRNSRKEPLLNEKPPIQLVLEIINNLPTILTEGSPERHFIDKLYRNYRDLFTEKNVEAITQLMTALSNDKALTANGQYRSEQSMTQPRSYWYALLLSPGVFAYLAGAPYTLENFSWVACARELDANTTTLWATLAIAVVAAAIDANVLARFIAARHPDCQRISADIYQPLQTHITQMGFDLNDAKRILEALTQPPNLITRTVSLQFGVSSLKKILTGGAVFGKMYGPIGMVGGALSAIPEALSEALVKVNGIGGDWLTHALKYYQLPPERNKTYLSPLLKNTMINGALVVAGYWFNLYGPILLTMTRLLTSQQIAMQSNPTALDHTFVRLAPELPFSISPRARVLYNFALGCILAGASLVPQIIKIVHCDHHINPNVKDITGVDPSDVPTTLSGKAMITFPFAAICAATAFTLSSSLIAAGSTLLIAQLIGTCCARRLFVLNGETQTALEGAPRTQRVLDNTLNRPCVRNAAGVISSLSGLAGGTYFALNTNAATSAKMVQAAGMFTALPIWLYCKNTSRSLAYFVTSLSMVLAGISTFMTETANVDNSLYSVIGCLVFAIFAQLGDASSIMKDYYIDHKKTPKTIPALDV